MGDNLNLVKIGAIEDEKYTYSLSSDGGFLYTAASHQSKLYLEVYKINVSTPTNILTKITSYEIVKSEYEEEPGPLLCASMSCEDGFVLFSAYIGGTDHYYLSIFYFDGAELNLISTRTGIIDGRCTFYGSKISDGYIYYNYVKTGYGSTKYTAVERIDSPSSVVVLYDDIATNYNSGIGWVGDFKVAKVNDEGDVYFNEYVPSANGWTGMAVANTDTLPFAYTERMYEADSEKYYYVTRDFSDSALYLTSLSKTPPYTFDSLSKLASPTTGLPVKFSLIITRGNTTANNIVVGANTTEIVINYFNNYDKKLYPISAESADPLHTSTSILDLSKDGLTVIQKQDGIGVSGQICMFGITGTISEFKGITGPFDAKVKAGNNANYSVYAEGNSLTYQWNINDGGVTGPIVGVTGLSYTFPVTGTDDTDRYFVDVNDEVFGTFRSYAALLTVGGSMVPTNPSSIYFYRGETGIFTDGVTGGIGPYTYQWQRKDN